jgi:integrase
MLIKAVQWGYIERSPAEHLSRPRIPQKEMEMYTADELKKILDEIDERFKVFFLTVCLTGMRQSEIVALRWSDVDFNSSRLFVRQKYRNKKFSEPKTEKSRRAILVPDILIEKLKVHQAWQAYTLRENKYDLVFTNTVGRLVDGKNFTNRNLRRAIRRAELREVKRPFHAIRHSYASMLINQGANIKFIQKQLGHSSAKITWDIYSHLYPEHERAEVEKLAENFGQITGKRPKEEGQPSDVTDPLTWQNPVGVTGFEPVTPTV